MRFPQAPANAVDKQLVSIAEGAQDARNDWETGPSSGWALRARRSEIGPLLRGFVTEADLPQAEREWPGLQDFLRRIPPHQRPVTFLELVWRFECWRHRRSA